jgi:AcrR family transcriptional regulator
VAIEQERTRDRVLRVAADIFAERGYHGTSVAELGELAGLKRGALYYHIGSKEDLLYDLCQRHVAEALERGRAAVDSQFTPLEKFRALVREHVCTLSDRRAEVTVVLREMHALTGERAQSLRELRATHQQLFAEVLSEGVEQGVFRSSDNVTVLAVLGMLNWTHVWFDPQHGPLTALDLAEKLTDIILKGELVQAN